MPQHLKKKKRKKRKMRMATEAIMAAHLDISACMSDPKKIAEFPDAKQRAAVCFRRAGGS